MRGSLKGWALSLPIAILLSLAVAGQAVAAAWSMPTPISAWGDYGQAFVSTGGATAVLGLSSADGIFAKRTTDGGVTWKGRVQIAEQGAGLRLAAQDATVDALWVVTNEWDEVTGPLMYRRSTTGARTFEPAIEVAPITAWDTTIGAFDVAHGPGGVVVVMWEEIKWWVAGGRDRYTTTVRVRVSRNNGASFGPRQTVASVRGVGGSAVAVGSGVIYVAFVVRYTELRLRRSFDGGANWTGELIATGYWDEWSGPPDLVADADHAYVAWEQGNRHGNSLRYRRTSDRGGTWSETLVLAGGYKTINESLHLSKQDGVLRAAFWRCPSDCNVAAQGETYYRQSNDGVHWTAMEEIAPTFDPGWRGYFPRDLMHLSGYTFALINEWRDFWDENGYLQSEARALVFRRTQ